MNVLEMWDYYFFCNQIVMPHPFLPILLHILQASTRYNADYKLSDLSCTQITLLHRHEQFFRSIAITEQIIGQIIDIRGFTGLETPNELHIRGALTDAHAHAVLIILMVVKRDRYSLLSRQLR